MQPLIQFKAIKSRIWNKSKYNFASSCLFHAIGKIASGDWFILKQVYYFQFLHFIFATIFAPLKLRKVRYNRIKNISRMFSNNE